jgi:hypothetical protein
VEALKRWKKLSEPRTEPSDHVFAENGAPLNVHHLAEQIRNDLLRVGVDRPQLCESSGTLQRFRAHDLRAKFVTISLATGKTETWVSDRTGHAGHTMIDKYRRKARTWNMGELGPPYELMPELADTEPTVRITPRLPLKLTARVAKQADAADLGSEPPQPESLAIDKTRQFDDPDCPEKGGVRTDLGQSWGNPRASAVAVLCRHATALADAGDLAGAREFREAVGRLLGDRTISAECIRRSFGVRRADERDVQTSGKLGEGPANVTDASPVIAVATAAASVAATVGAVEPPITATIDENTEIDSIHHAPRRWHLKTGESEPSRAVAQDSAALESESAREEVQSGSVLPPVAAASDPDAVDLVEVPDGAASDPPPDLEVLLAQALHLAAAAGRWEIVAQLAREIEARRTGASTNAHVADREAKRGAQECRSPSQNGTTKKEEREG